MSLDFSLLVRILQSMVYLYLTSGAIAINFRHSYEAGYRSLTSESKSVSSISPENRTLCQSGSQEPANRVNTTIRLTALREQMKSHDLDAYLIVMTDEHGSYSGTGTGYYAVINYISGFSGSSGFAIVTRNQSALWTDARYFLQADNQMDCNWILMQMGEPGYPNTAWEWTKDVLPVGAKIGAYPRVVDQSTWLIYEDNLKNQGQEFVAVTEELVGEIWPSSERPQKPNNPLIIHDLSFAGMSWQDKLSEIRSKISPADELVVTLLEHVAWLFNLRGSDKSNSLFYAYAIIHQRSASLYVANHATLITADLQRHLNISDDGQCLFPAETTCINVYEYNDIYSDVRQLTNVTIWVDPTANYAIYNATSHLHRTVAMSPIERTKSIKNPVERQRFRECIFRDSSAVIEFAQFIEERIVVKQETNWTELGAAAKLLSIRQSYPNFRGVSFATIAAVGPHAAVIHYRPEESTDARIDTSAIFLLDSGGQYLDGTTDVTRTFHFGQPTDQMQDAYTRILMGQIDLARAVWREGLLGNELDVIARLPLHRNGWDFNHVSGHGIGYFLSVSEGPTRIDRGYNPSGQQLAEGMFFSDEPGFYEDNQFGIRLENLVTVIKANTSNQFASQDYLTFDTLTLVPYETKLIKYDLLSIAQKEWLNQYNQRCRIDMGNYLLNERHNPAAHQWVLQRTEQIPVYTGSQTHVTSGIVMIAASLLASLSANLH